MGCNGLHAAGVHHRGAVDCRLAGKVLLRCGRNQSRLPTAVHVGRNVEKAPDLDEMVRAARGHRVDDRKVIGGWVENGSVEIP